MFSFFPFLLYFLRTSIISKISSITITLNRVEMPMNIHNDFAISSHAKGGPPKKGKECNNKMLLDNKKKKQ